MEFWWNDTYEGVGAMYGEETLPPSPPVSLCPPQFSHGLTWNQSWASAVAGQRINVWAIVRYRCVQVVLNVSFRNGISRSPIRTTRVTHHQAGSYRYATTRTYNSPLPTTGMKVLQPLLSSECPSKLQNSFTHTLHNIRSFIPLLADIASISISSILPFQGHKVAAYVFFLVFPSLLT